MYATVVFKDLNGLKWFSVRDQPGAVDNLKRWLREQGRPAIAVIRARRRRPFWSPSRERYCVQPDD